MSTSCSSEHAYLFSLPHAGLVGRGPQVLRMMTCVHTSSYVTIRLVGRGPQVLRMMMYDDVCNECICRYTSPYISRVVAHRSCAERLCAVRPPLPLSLQTRPVTAPYLLEPITCF